MGSEVKATVNELTIDPVLVMRYLCKVKGQNPTDLMFETLGCINEMIKSRQRRKKKMFQSFVALYFYHYRGNANEKSASSALTDK